MEISRKNSLLWLLVATTLLFLICGLSVYFYFRNKKKLTEQREINLAQKLVEKEKTEELIVAKAMLDGEERERHRLAKELHDGLGGMLAGVKINLTTWANNNLVGNQTENFNKILIQLDTSISELRHMRKTLCQKAC